MEAEVEEGKHRIDGVPGTGAKIILDWADSAGSLTGKLLPTGRVTNTIKVEGEGDFEVSLVDAAIPTVFIRAEALGLKGSETPQQIDADKKLLQKIEKIRSVAALQSECLIKLILTRGSATARGYGAPAFCFASSSRNACSRSAT